MESTEILSLIMPMICLKDAKKMPYICPIGWLKKTKFRILISWHCFPIPLPCGWYQKKIESLGICKLSLWHPSKWCWPLYKWKKNPSDYRVHGIQTDRLGLTVSTQKSVLKNMHRVLRYWPKCVKFCRFGLEGRF